LKYTRAATVTRMKARGEARRLLSLLLAGAFVDEELAEAELLADVDVVVAPEELLLVAVVVPLADDELPVVELPVVAAEVEEPVALAEPVVELATTDPPRVPEALPWYAKSWLKFVLVPSAISKA